MSEPSAVQPKSESVILCEGYHDRAFWAGWLTHLGCTDLGVRADGARRCKVYDPGNDLVKRGEYAYRSRSGRFLRVVPCSGKNNVPRMAESRLNDRRDKALAHLVLNVDSDQIAAWLDDPARTTVEPTDVGRVVETFGTVEENGNGDLVLDGGTIVSAVCWEAGDPPTAGLPAQQCLERLVCAALVAAYPRRGPAVTNWLDSRPDAPVAGPKEFAWSHMAGWYAEYGSETFFRKLWLDASAVAELQPRLTACGAWRVAETLVR